MEFVPGLEVAQNTRKRAIKLTQTRYILDLLEKFGLSNANPTPTPM